MKTLIWIVFFVMINTSALTAQPIRAYGLKVGYAKAEQRWQYAQQSTWASAIEPRWGFDVGLFIELFDHPHFSILTEIYYIQKGRTITATGTLVANNEQGYINLGLKRMKQRFDYLSIPILAKLRFNGSMLTPFIAAGPSLEYLISYPPSDMCKKFNKAEFAVKFAAGFELSLHVIPKLLAEIRYNRSLTNAYKNASVTVNNRVVELLVGVAF